MEVCKGGELYDAVQERKGNYTEDEAASVIRQILKVRVYLPTYFLFFLASAQDGARHSDQNTALLTLAPSLFHAKREGPGALPQQWDRLLRCEA